MTPGGPKLTKEAKSTTFGNMGGSEVELALQRHETILKGVIRDLHLVKNLILPPHPSAAKAKFSCATPLLELPEEGPLLRGATTPPTPRVEVAAEAPRPAAQARAEPPAIPPALPAPAPAATPADAAQLAELACKVAQIEARLASCESAKPNSRQLQQLVSATTRASPSCDTPRTLQAFSDMDDFDSTVWQMISDMELQALSDGTPSLAGGLPDCEGLLAAAGEAELSEEMLQQHAGASQPGVEHSLVDSADLSSRWGSEARGSQGARPSVRRASGRKPSGVPSELLGENWPKARCARDRMMLPSATPDQMMRPEAS